MSDEKTPREIAVLGPPSPDGSIPAVRIGPHGVSSGTFRASKDGDSLLGRETFDLKRTEGSNVYEMVPVYDGRASSPGPAMVNSPKFKSGWDAVFGDRGKAGALN
jgi:hypothetical protein